MPSNESICINSIDHDHEYEIRFHGKPVRIFPLQNSNTENISEKNKRKEIFFSAYGPTIKTTNPKNIDKNSGISISAIGIKFLKFSSCVKDIEIQ